MRVFNPPTPPARIGTPLRKVSTGPRTKIEDPTLSKVSPYVKTLDGCWWSQVGPDTAQVPVGSSVTHVG